MKYTLRNYQEDSVKAGIDFFNSNAKHGALIVAPTASGKALLIANICKQIKGKTIILQPSLEILEQNLEKAHSFGIKDIGVYSASAGRKDFGNIVFATIGTIIKKKELFHDFENLIADEAHLINAKGGQYKELIDHFGGKILGLTATPFRMHSVADRFGNRAVIAKMLTRTRPRIFKEIINITQIQQLYKDGFLCPVKYRRLKTYDYRKIKLNSTGMDFDKDSLEKYNKTQNIINIVAYEIKNNNSKHFLVFTTSVVEAESLSLKLNEYKICSATISAKTPKKERAELLEKFKSGEIKVITNVGTMTTGYDFPSLDCCILSRPTQSIALYMQMVGRVMRISTNKEFSTVIDVCGNVDRFGKIETFEMVKTSAGLDRMKSNVNFLTGYDFIGERDLELINYKGFKESKWEDNCVIMQWGAHKNKYISKVPTAYLQWCVKTFNNGAWKDKFKKELIRRNI